MFNFMHNQTNDRANKNSVNKALDILAPPLLFLLALCLCLGIFLEHTKAKQLQVPLCPEASTDQEQNKRKKLFLTDTWESLQY